MAENDELNPYIAENKEGVVGFVERLAHVGFMQLK